MKVHENYIGITFEFEAITSLTITNFFYNSTSALKAYGFSFEKLYNYFIKNVLIWCFPYVRLEISIIVSVEILFNGQKL